MFFKLLTISSLCLLTLALPDGAPEAACDMRIPHHSTHQPQATAAPFRVEAVSTNGGKYKVKISPTDSGEFKGFLLAAIDTSSKNYVGTFTPVDHSKTLACPKGSAITHSDATPKNKIEVEWTKPTGYTGTVEFTATVVREFSTFWTNIVTSAKIA